MGGHSHKCGNYKEERTIFCRLGRKEKSRSLHTPDTTPPPPPRHIIAKHRNNNVPRRVDRRLRLVVDFRPNLKVRHTETRCRDGWVVADADARERGFCGVGSLRVFRSHGRDGVQAIAPSRERPLQANRTPTTAEIGASKHTILSHACNPVGFATELRRGEPPAN